MLTGMHECQSELTLTIHWHIYTKHRLGHGCHPIIHLISLANVYTCMHLIFHLYTSQKL